MMRYGKDKGLSNLMLYNSYSTYIVIFGIIFIHVLIFGLCIFFIYRFLLQSYNPSVFFPLLMLIGGIVSCDFLAHKTQAFGRFFVRCKVNYEGIHCFGLGCKPWRISWNDIHVYGISGFSDSKRSYGILFLSTDANEKFTKSNYATLNKQRIVFEVRDEITEAISIFMPDKIKNNLLKAINNKEDCFYRR